MAAITVAVVGGGLLVMAPGMLVVALAALALASAVACRPAVAAYVLIGATPLTAGIDRGLLIPFLRPNEALAVLVGGALLLRWLPQLLTERPLTVRLRRTDATIVAMAITSSLVPLLWMLLRGKDITVDDLLYALTLWKYYGLFLIIRASVRTQAQIRRCLVLGMASAAIVAIIAILQSLKLFGVPQLLAYYYAAFGNVAALEISRGSSTLSLPVAVADLMTFNIAVAWAWLARDRRHQGALYAAMALFVLGTLASGQFSGAIALVLCALALAFIAGRARPLVASIPMAFVASIVLRPVILNRLSGFSSPEGLPESWVARLDNLRSYFWPELFSNFNFVLGVRPSARVATSSPWQRYVWIESGYTWLLWAGGIPFLLSFLYFLRENIRATLSRARRRMDIVGVAATGSCVSLVIVGVLMMFDPHLTYRGSGDFLFALLALATCGIGTGADDTDGDPPELGERPKALTTPTKPQAADEQTSGTAGGAAGRGQPRR